MPTQVIVQFDVDPNDIRPTLSEDEIKQRAKELVDVALRYSEAYGYRAPAQQRGKNVVATVQIQNVYPLDRKEPIAIPATPKLTIGMTDDVRPHFLCCLTESGHCDECQPEEEIIFDLEMSIADLRISEAGAETNSEAKRVKNVVDMLCHALKLMTQDRPQVKSNLITSIQFTVDELTALQEVAASAVNVAGYKMTGPAQWAMNRIFERWKSMINARVKDHDKAKK